MVNNYFCDDYDDDDDDDYDDDDDDGNDDDDDVSRITCSSLTLVVATAPSPRHTLLRLPQCPANTNCKAAAKKRY